MLKTGSRVNLEGQSPYDSIVVGLDNATGFFIQGYQDGELVLDKSTNAMLPQEEEASRGEILELIEKHAKESPKRKKVLDAIAMDLDPSEKVSAKNLKGRLIRLGSKHPDLQPDLKPVIDRLEEDRKDTKLSYQNLLMDEIFDDGSFISLMQQAPEDKKLHKILAKIRDRFREMFDPQDKNMKALLKTKEILADQPRTKTNLKERVGHIASLLGIDASDLFS